MPEKEKKKSRLFEVLTSTRRSIAASVTDLFAAGGKIQTADLERLHDSLILSDMGIDAADMIMQAIQAANKRSALDGASLRATVKQEIINILEPCQRPVDFLRDSSPAVVLMAGVNGTGKTTTIAKIAHYCSRQNHKVMLAACDTYRPAAIEQLQHWGNRLELPVIAQAAGSDPAAVAHDAMHAAAARDCSLLLIDTAGRQQTRDDLMRQLDKIRRVITKIEPSAPHETLLTIDAGTGQNALSQVESFHSHCPLSGLCLTKLDGTAKGGIAVALTMKFSLPVYFVGLGEKIDDLAEFDPQAYTHSLFDS